MLETVYEVSLVCKLEKRELFVQRQVPICIVYEAQEFKAGFRADLIIEGNGESKCFFDAVRVIRFTVRNHPSQANLFVRAVRSITVPRLRNSHESGWPLKVPRLVLRS